MSAPIQKSVVYQAAIRIYLQEIDKSPEAVQDYTIPGSKETYREHEMRKAARMAWDMVSAVDHTSPE